MDNGNGFSLNKDIKKNIELTGSNVDPPKKSLNFKNPADNPTSNSSIEKKPVQQAIEYVIMEQEKLYKQLDSINGHLRDSSWIIHILTEDSIPLDKKIIIANTLIESYESGHSITEGTRWIKLISNIL